MAILPTFPRQVRVIKCALLSPGMGLRAGNAQDTTSLKQGFDLLPYVQKLDIYESIFDNTISGTLTLLENVGLTEYLPIVGVETIAIAFQVDDPNPAQPPQSFVQVFRVVGLQNQAFPRHDWRMYELILVTPEYVTSLSSRVCRAFRSMTATDAVQNILSKDLGVSKFDVEASFGNVDVVIPNYTPLMAVNYFTVLAQTKDSNHESNFMFYQTMRDGFHFRSVSSLIKEFAQKSDDKLTTFDVDSGQITAAQTVTADDVEGRIMRVHQNQGFDLLSDILGGTLRSRMVHFDFLARRFDHQDDSRYTNTFDKTTHLDKYPVYPRNFDLSVNKNVRIFGVPSNVWSSKSKYTESIEDQPEQKLHESVLLRNRQLKELKHVETLIDVPGQPDVSAGDVVIVNYPSTRALQGIDTSINTPNAGQRTPYYSGRHLVTGIHHILLTKTPGSMEYRMNIKVNRDSFGTPLIGAQDSDES